MTHWICIGSMPATPPCGASGSYTHNAISGDSGPARQHTKTTGHGTLAAATEWKAAA